METIRSSETSVFTRVTQRHIPEGDIIQCCLLISAVNKICSSLLEKCEINGRLELFIVFENLICYGMIARKVISVENEYKSNFELIYLETVKGGEEERV
jgi:hypothetical protein